MFGPLQNFFVRKISSIEKFVQVVKNENFSHVQVLPFIDTETEVERVTRDTLIDFHYVLEVVSTTSKKRKILYHQECFKITDCRSFSKTQMVSVIRLLLFGEDMVKRLQKELPDLKIDLVGPDGVIGKSGYENLHKDAERYGVKLS